jgi:hypothetical protein
MEFIIRKLTQNQIGEQNATSQSDSKPEKVDKRVTLVLEKVSYRDSEVVFEHGFSISDLGLRIAVASMVVDAAIRNPQSAIDSFVPQRLHRVRQRRFNRLRAHRYQRDDQC